LQRWKGGACVELNAQGHEELAERLREVLQGDQRPELLVKVGAERAMKAPLDRSTCTASHSGVEGDPEPIHQWAKKGEKGVGDEGTKVWVVFGSYGQAANMLSNIGTANGMKAANLGRLRNHGVNAETDIIELNALEHEELAEQLCQVLQGD
jgi:hypothetical protein